jgi:hypothetical protein
MNAKTAQIRQAVDTALAQGISPRVCYSGAKIWAPKRHFGVIASSSARRVVVVNEETGERKQMDWGWVVALAPKLSA